MRVFVFASLLLSACGGMVVSQDPPIPEDEGPVLVPRSAASPGEGLAPEGVVPGEQLAQDGVNPVGGESVFRVETLPRQHVAFDLRFTGGTGVTLAVDRWDGQAPARIGITDAGPGLRVLAVLDQGEPRTFWVRVAGTNLAGAQLTVTRTAFEDRSTCSTDCARLLQLPLPNDPAVDGYSLAGAIFRYQFGRRDLLMFIRYAGRSRIESGMAPYLVGDVSQWDGETPGTDTGNLRHASHDRGKDVDISLYGTDGKAPWRSYCTTMNDGSGRECVAGTRKDFDGAANRSLMDAYAKSGRVTYFFLDAELIKVVTPGFKQLQHWPNHDNHVHVRVSEAADGPLPAAPFFFQAP
jgi:hypothetical protein